MSTLMQITEPHYTDVTAVRRCKVTVSLNHFELNADWGMSSTTMAEWAHEALEQWLRNRMDLTSPSVYDSGQTGKGRDHG